MAALSVAAHHAGHADFRHPALGREHAFACRRVFPVTVTLPPQGFEAVSAPGDARFAAEPLQRLGDGRGSGCSTLAGLALGASGIAPGEDVQDAPMGVAGAGSARSGSTGRGRRAGPWPSPARSISRLPIPGPSRCSTARRTRSSRGRKWRLLSPQACGSPLPRRVCPARRGTGWRDQFFELAGTAGTHRRRRRGILSATEPRAALPVKEGVRDLLIVRFTEAGSGRG